MSATQILLPPVVLAGGMAAGVMMWTQLGGWPLLASLPPNQYVATHAFFTTRYDPFMPICMVVAALGDVVLAVVADQAVAQSLAGIAAVLSVCSVVISLSKNVPVNKWLRTLDADRLPADFDTVDPRKFWGRWNRVRAVLAVTAFAANCLALGALL